MDVFLPLIAVTIIVIFMVSSAAAHPFVPRRDKEGATEGSQARFEERSDEEGGIGSEPETPSYSAYERAHGPVEPVLRDGRTIEKSLEDKMTSTLQDEYEEAERHEVVVRMKPRRGEIGDGQNEDQDDFEFTTALKEGAEKAQSSVEEIVEEGDGDIINTFWISNAMVVEVCSDTLDDLVEEDHVWKVHENFEVEIDSSDGGMNSSYTPADASPEDQDLTWGLGRINASEVWQKNIEGEGVRVAVSDTGVDIDHPDLEGKMVNIPDDSYYTGGWIEFDQYGNPVEDSEPRDTHWHGTHCSGTVLGGDASGTHIGVAPEAELMHALGLPDGGGTFSQLLAAIEWKAEPHDMHGEPLHEEYGGEVDDYRAHVASMSWGMDGYEDAWEDPILNLVDTGVVPISSIGNDGEGTHGSPANIFETFGVGASNNDDDIASFSSGDIVEDGRDDTPDEYVQPDFSAPGVNVLSAVPGEDWGSAQGTSMAAPHVAGAVALMLEANSNLSVDGVYEALEETAHYYEAGDDLGEDKNTRYGHGILDAYGAVDHVFEPCTEPPTEIEIDVDGDDHVLEWEVTGVSTFNIYYSHDRYKGVDEWELAGEGVEGVDGTVSFEHEDVMDGEDEAYYYIVTATETDNGWDEGEKSDVAFHVERELEEGTQRISVPQRMNNLDAITPQDIVEDIEGDLDEAPEYLQEIGAVQRWDREDRFGEGVADWTGSEWVFKNISFDPGDGISLQAQVDFVWDITGMDANDTITIEEGERPLVYVSLPYTLANQTSEGQLNASDIVTIVEGDLETSDKIFEVLRPDGASYDKIYHYDTLAGEWFGDDFVIEPGDGVGLMIQENVEINWEVELIVEGW